MKCPKCKKPSELQTKRTLANGREVTRERYCRKCKNKFITIERFDKDIAEEQSKYERKISILEQEKDALEHQLNNVKEIFRGFKSFMDISAKR